MKTFEECKESILWANNMLAIAWAHRNDLDAILSEESKTKVIIITDISKAMKICGKKLTPAQFDYLYDEPIYNLEKLSKSYADKANEHVRAGIL